MMNSYFTPPRGNQFPLQIWDGRTFCISLPLPSEKVYKKCFILVEILWENILLYCGQTYFISVISEHLEMPRHR